MPGRVQTSEAAGMGMRLRPVMASVLSGLVFCVVLLLIMSIIITTQNIPQSFIEPMAIFAIAAGSFVSGWLCSRTLRSNGLINGLMCGVVICVIIIIAGIFVSTAGMGMPLLFRVAFIMLSAMLGGVIGVNTRRRHR